MSKKIATISYEKEISDFEYDNLFNSLKSDEKMSFFVILKVRFLIQMLNVGNVKLL